MATSNNRMERKFIVTEISIFAVIWFFVSFLGAGLLFPLATKLMGIDDIQAFIGQLSIDSSSSDRFYAKLIMIINQCVTFLVPSLIFLLWIHKRKSIQFLHLNRFPKVNLLLFGCLLMIAAYPLTNLILKLNQLLPLTQDLSTLENKANNTAAVFLIMNTPREFLMSIFTIAVVPAIAEEIFFRGILQNYLSRQNAVKGILLTAFVFAAIHMQWASFLPRFFLGIILGYLFYWSKSLWLPILAHFVFNGMQIIPAYYASSDQLQESSSLSELPVGLIIFSFVLTGVLGCLVYSNRVEKDSSLEKTPY